MTAALKLKAIGAIDGHTHLFAEPDYIERHIEAAERLGIRRSVVSGLGRPWGLLDNAATLAAAERHPDRLIPLAFVLLGRDKPDCVARAKRQGFKGLKFTQPLFPYDDERAFPFYAAAEELRMPILFHCGVLAHMPGVVTSSEFMRPMRLDGVARRFPGLRIQIAHLGVPEYEVATTLARIVPNICVDMTGSPRGGWYTAKSPQFIRSLFHWPTWHRKLIFGTDVRMELLPKALRAHTRLLSAFRLTPEMRASIYRDNARGFLGETERAPYETVGWSSSGKEEADE